MSAPPFTPEQEERIRELFAEEREALRATPEEAAAGRAEFTAALGRLRAWVDQ